MAKVKRVTEDSEALDPEVLEPEIVDPDELNTSGESHGSKHGQSGGIGVTKTGKGKHMRTRKKKTMSNPRAASGGLLGDMNITKVIMIAAGGALLWDYMTAGKFIGVFGPNGWFSGLLGAPATGTGAGKIEPYAGGPGPFNPRSIPNPEPVQPQPGTATPGTSTAPQSNYADYLRSINASPTGSVSAGGTEVGGDTNRDLAKFNSNSRYRNATLSRAAQGAPYSVAIVRAANMVNNWDQWNWYRGQQGGTPIDIDALGVADRRGSNITIDQFLSVAGVDPSESGMSGLANASPYTGLEWLM
jgi:hypothetical protein